MYFPRCYSCAISAENGAKSKFLADIWTIWWIYNFTLSFYIKNSSIDTRPLIGFYFFIIAILFQKIFFHIKFERSSPITRCTANKVTCFLLYVRCYVSSFTSSASRESYTCYYKDKNKTEFLHFLFPLVVRYIYFCIFFGFCQ